MQLEGGLLFQGTFRLVIPRHAMTRIAAEAGELVIGFDGADARFDLGAAADKWADRLLNPPSLLDKLGVKAGMRVSLIGGFPEEFVAELRSRAEVQERGKKESGAVLLLASTPADLHKVPAAIDLLKPDGGLWIVYPKGQRVISESQVMSAGRGAGLTDNKVAAFSATHTALRFVVPMKLRGKRT